MRLLKMLGPAAVAALAAMALIGVGSAQATALCAAAPEPGNKCPAGTKYGLGNIKATAENPILTNSVSNISCKHSEIKFNIANAGGPAATVTGQVTEMEFLSCKTATLGLSCTLEVANLPFNFEFHVTASGNGSLTVANGGGGEPRVKTSCAGGVIKCDFGLEITSEVFGGNPAIIEVVNVASPVTGTAGFMACPMTAAWDYKYKATAPTNIWVAKE